MPRAYPAKLTSVRLCNWLPFARLVISFLALSLGAPLRVLATPSFDCARAGSAVEKSICAHDDLARMDRQLADLYRRSLAMMTSDTRKAFVSSQKAWLESRANSCPAAAAKCLLGRYGERQAAFQAMLATTSRENPVLNQDNPISIEGTWQVELPAKDIPNHLHPIASSLPPENSRLDFETGKACLSAQSTPSKCYRYGILPAAGRDTWVNIRAKFKLTNGNPTFLTFIDGRAGYEILPLRDGTILALTMACDAKANECAETYQIWRPVSPGAAIRKFTIFGP